MTEWDRERVTALTRTCIRLGLHPRAWKTARGIVLRKPNKLDYAKVKAYRVISLLPCLGKVVEKVVADLLSETCEHGDLLHRGQFGCRRWRSSVDAVAVLISRAEAAWARGEVAGALLMDVKGAFDHVARGRLVEGMLRAGIEPDLARWTENFMTDRRVRMVIDGTEMAERRVDTGIPQGSPTSPILFAIYLRDVFGHVEEATITGPGAAASIEGLSFVDDVAWVATGSIEEVTARLSACARLSGEWANMNAVAFDVAKTEAVLLSRRPKHITDDHRATHKIDIGLPEPIQYNGTATRWLGVWLDSKLTLADHHKRCQPGTVPTK